MPADQLRLRRQALRHLLFPLAIALAAPPAAQTNPQARLPEANRDGWALVDKSLGLAGTTQPDGVAGTASRAAI